MLSFFERDGWRAGQWSRRAWLRLGGWGAVSALAAGAPSAAVRAAIGAPRRDGFGRAKSVIVVFANGGQSQLEMWDPKPLAPLDVRGEFQAISTAVPGLQIGEHLPRVARVLDRCAVVRSLSHEDLDHGSAVYLTLTGVYNPRRSGNPPPTPIDVPTLGSVLRRVRPGGKFVQEAVHVNGPILVPTTASPGQNAGILGRAFDPLVVGDPTASNEPIPGLAPHVDLPPERMDDRLALKQTLDAAHASLAQLAITADLGRQFDQARQFLESPRTRDAFRLDSEPERIRDRYGRHRSGQSLLLARRLAEAGVPYINVIWNHSNRGQDSEPDDTDSYGWDTHNDIFVAMRDRLLPRFDESFSALIEDLDERGLLDDTLVVCVGEFGRAPKVALEPRFAGASPGRKHWPHVYSMVVAGAGVQRGAIIGASDRWAAEPTTERYGPWDIAATIFHALGIDPRRHYEDPVGRTFPIASGQPIAALY